MRLGVTRRLLRLKGPSRPLDFCGFSGGGSRLYFDHIYTSCFIRSWRVTASLGRAREGVARSRTPRQRRPYGIRIARSKTRLPGGPGGRARPAFEAAPPTQPREEEWGLLAAHYFYRRPSRILRMARESRRLIIRGGVYPSRHFTIRRRKIRNVSQRGSVTYGWLLKARRARKRGRP